MPHETEEQFQRSVVELASYYGWSVYHTHDSRRSAPGFPDLVLLRPPELIFAELKTAKGRVTAAQREWLARLRACGQQAYLWRPEMFDGIHEVLKTRKEEAWQMTHV